MTKKLMHILLLTNTKNTKLWEKYESEFKKYFKLKIIKDEPNNINKYLDKTIDILFLNNPKIFKLEYYQNFQSNNSSFCYVVFYNNIKIQRDIKTFKVEIADRIIYTNIDEKLYKWSILSVLRRFWNTYSKPSTIIYKHIIADFLEQNFWVNKKNVELTPKESKIFRLLLLHKKQYVKKSFIFSEIWGFSNDNTRTVDQTLFKLKMKIGPEHFVITRNKGVMLK